MQRNFTIDIFEIGFKMLSLKLLSFGEKMEKVMFIIHYSQIYIKRAHFVRKKVFVLYRYPLYREVSYMSLAVNLFWQS